MTLPLVPVPQGCAAPTLPHIVFVGKVVDRDYRSVRFEIEQIRAGRPDPFSSGDLIDVRYGLDAQYLDDGGRYLVSAPRSSPELGFLVSRVAEPIADFGGDEVIGVSESDVNCPEFEDPMRTLNIDGTASRRHARTVLSARAPDPGRDPGAARRRCRGSSCWRCSG